AAVRGCQPADLSAGRGAGPVLYAGGRHDRRDLCPDRRSGPGPAERSTRAPGVAAFGGDPDVWRRVAGAAETALGPDLRTPLLALFIRIFFQCLLRESKPTVAG